jgi:hypothetical protein
LPCSAQLTLDSGSRGRCRPAAQGRHEACSGRGRLAALEADPGSDSYKLYVRDRKGGTKRLLVIPETLALDESAPGALVRLLDDVASRGRCRSRQEIGRSHRHHPACKDRLRGHHLDRGYKAKSADGPLVPLSIIHKKGLPRSGENPTYLNGYGAYGSVYEPAFEPMHLAWLERGGIIAVCHVRGGEHGEDWHRAGKLASKPNTIDDFVACSEYLVRERYRSPGHLAGQGTNAGGIMIGGAIVRRPDLFGAAIIDHPRRHGQRAALRADPDRSVQHRRVRIGR